MCIRDSAHPEAAWSDGAQSVRPERFASIIQKGRTIAQVIGRDL